MTFEPELRPGPPWVMEEMIWAQLDLPEQIASSADAARLASHVRKAADTGEPVLFTGCGTSEHAARAAQAIVADALPDATLASRDAFEARLALPAAGLVVAISHEAGTAATLDAARGASDAGARAGTSAGTQGLRAPMRSVVCRRAGFSQRGIRVTLRRPSRQACTVRRSFLCHGDALKSLACGNAGLRMVGGRKRATTMTAPRPRSRSSQSSWTPGYSRLRSARSLCASPPTARPRRRSGPTPRRCSGSPPPACPAGPAGSRWTGKTSSSGWRGCWTVTAAPTPATSTAPCSSSSSGWPPRAERNASGRALGQLAADGGGLLDRRQASCRGYPLFHIHARPQLCGG